MRGRGRPRQPKTAGMPVGGHSPRGIEREMVTALAICCDRDGGRLEGVLRGSALSIDWRRAERHRVAGVGPERCQPAVSCGRLIQFLLATDPLVEVAFSEPEFAAQPHGWQHTRGGPPPQIRVRQEQVHDLVGREEFGIRRWRRVVLPHGNSERGLSQRRARSQTWPHASSPSAAIRECVARSAQRSRARFTAYGHPCDWRRWAFSLAALLEISGEARLSPGPNSVGVCAWA